MAKLKIKFIYSYFININFLKICRNNQPNLTNKPMATRIRKIKTLFELIAKVPVVDSQVWHRNRCWTRITCKSLKIAMARLNILWGLEKWSKIPDQFHKILTIHLPNRLKLKRMQENKEQDGIFLNSEIHSKIFQVGSILKITKQFKEVVRMKEKVQKHLENRI